MYSRSSNVVLWFMWSTRTSKTKRCRVTNFSKLSKLRTRSILILLLRSLFIKLIQICLCKTNKSLMRSTRFRKICEDCSQSTALEMDTKKFKLAIILPLFTTTLFTKPYLELSKNFSHKSSTSNNSWTSLSEQVKFKRLSCSTLFLRFI